MSFLKRIFVFCRQFNLCIRQKGFDSFIVILGPYTDTPWCYATAKDLNPIYIDMSKEKLEMDHLQTPPAYDENEHIKRRYILESKITMIV